MLPSDFLDAHFRHLEDAHLLHREQKWANASHLYGFSGECGLKALMAATDPAKWPNGDPSNNKDKVHIQETRKQGLWDRYQDFLSGSSAPAYSLPTTSNPFNDWDASDRYANRSAFSREKVADHKQGAEFIGQLIKQARESGLLP